MQRLCEPPTRLLHVSCPLCDLLSRLLHLCESYISRPLHDGMRIGPLQVRRILAREAHFLPVAVKAMRILFKVAAQGNLRERSQRDGLWYIGVAQLYGLHVLQGCKCGLYPFGVRPQPGLKYDISWLVLSCSITSSNNDSTAVIFPRCSMTG